MYDRCVGYSRSCQNGQRPGNGAEIRRLFVVVHERDAAFGLYFTSPCLALLSFADLIAYKLRLR